MRERNLVPGAGFELATSGHGPINCSPDYESGAQTRLGYPGNLHTHNFANTNLTIYQSFPNDFPPMVDIQQDWVIAQKHSKTRVNFLGATLLYLGPTWRTLGTNLL